MPSVSFRLFSSARICLVVCGSSAEVASVAQQNARVVGEGARNGHALLLAAGKLRGIRVGLVVDLHQPQQLFGLFPVSARGKGRFPSSANATFSTTVREGIRLKCWKIIPIFRRAARNSPADICIRSRPSMRTTPESGRSSRLMQRTSVDLPAPEKPMMP